MSYVQYAIESPDGKIRRSGCEASLQCKYGGAVKQTITGNGTVTKSTKNKMMNGDLQFGSSAVIPCNNKVMPDDIVIKTQTVTGNRYQELTVSRQWTVPPGVTLITVICIGGGGGTTGGYQGSVRYWRCGGAGGGYVKRQNVSVTPGQTLTASIGAGGSRGYASYSTTYYERPTKGGDTVAVVNGVTIKGTGGEYCEAGYFYGGNGGSGGGAGYYYNEATRGGSNGGNGADDTSSGDYKGYGGKGQLSVTGPKGESGNTTVNGYAYSAGGGGKGGVSGRGLSGDAAAANTGDGANASNSNGYGYNGASGKVIIMW